MVFGQLVKAASIGVAATFALTLGATGTMAQTKDKSAPAAAPQKAPAVQPAAVPAARAVEWYKLCRDVPVPDPVKPGEQPKQQKPEEMKKVNVCLTQTDIRDEQTKIPIGMVRVQQIPNQEKSLLTVMLPPGLIIPAGAVAKIDETEVRLGYLTCSQACIAEAVVEPAVISQMKKAKDFRYMGLAPTGQVVGAPPIMLDAFGKTYDGPPVPIEKFTEDQKKINEQIVQKVAELRKKQEEEAAKNAAAKPA